MSVRLWAAMASIVFAALLASVVYISFGPENVVVPTASLKATSGAKGAEPAAKSQQAAPTDALARRTRLQTEQTTASGEKALALSSTGEAMAMQPGATGGRAAVQDWIRDLPADSDRFLQRREYRSGVSSLPYREADVFVQPQGRTFRQAHNDQIRYGGGWLVFGTCLALALFLLGRGRIGLAEGESGRTVLRFNAVERATHWMTASSFLVMAITGLIILYGKPLLLPWMGARVFSTLAAWSAWVHMALMVPFVLGILMMAVMWMRANVPTWLDWEWLKQGGGFLRDDGHNLPAGRFNAGQKLVFWSVIIGGLLLLLTGLGLMYPFLVAGYSGMQAIQLAHAGIALVMVAIIIGHIYIGSVGMVGAFQAMWSGLVDSNWAKEHHALWYRTLPQSRRDDPLGSGDGQCAVFSSGFARRPRWRRLASTSSGRLRFRRRSSPRVSDRCACEHGCRCCRAGCAGPP